MKGPQLLLPSPAEPSAAAAGPGGGQPEEEPMSAPSPQEGALQNSQPGEIIAGRSFEALGIDMLSAPKKRPLTTKPWKNPLGLLGGASLKFELIQKFANFFEICENRF